MPDVPNSVNLTLAGHLHGGQVRLFDAITVPSKFGTKYANGFLDDNGKKYIQHSVSEQVFCP